MTSLKLVLRLATISGSILLLLIPLLMIRGTVQDRQCYRAELVQRVSQSKAGEQRLLGPLRVMPWTQVRDVAVVDAEGKRSVKRETESGYDLQTPRRLAISGELKPSQRSIGLFKVQVYRWHARLKAQFDDLAYAAVEGRRYGQPSLLVGIQDVRGLVVTPTLRTDGKALALQPGSLALAGHSKGVHALLPALADARQGKLTDLHSVEMEFVLDGTQGLSIVPVGDDNQIALSSPWPHPLFCGRFLPNERRITEQGVQANWALSSLATGAQGQLASGSEDLDARPGLRHVGTHREAGCKTPHRPGHRQAGSATQTPAVEFTDGRSAPHPAPARRADRPVPGRCRTAAHRRVPRLAVSVRRRPGLRARVSVRLCRLAG
ncbi:cell envelope integrity protein CreD [Xanthomonas translucens pv. translucens]|uniref:cell envelope integrity protein CreD n=1 Tax=Xanthomonas campestris pv. translucens TaxID=343 RepID=UPI0021B7BC70|nr:cell envelope integrity protein CreD [Xanthomonas translucens]MCT8284833.1 cell envelope integrity protein CreD [Xanthomonas translucens pv. translucens]MCT8302491.1 cell envelope integrity protein CreD [Xanthomonas translucens pv. translucens]